MDKEMLKIIKAAIKQENQKDPLEGLEDTIREALEVMPLARIYQLLRDSGRYTVSKTTFTKWVDARGLRPRRRMASVEATEARRQGRLKAIAARAAAKRVDGSSAVCPSCGGDMCTETDGAIYFWECPACGVCYQYDAGRIGDKLNRQYPFNVAEITAEKPDQDS